MTTRNNYYTGFDVNSIHEIEDSEFVYEDNPRATSEEFGFQDKIYDNSEIFELTAYEPPNLNLKYDKIKRVSFSDSCWVILTENNRVIRWRIFDPEDKSVNEYDIPEKTEDNAGLLTNVWNKTLAMGEKKVAIIERIYQDIKGNHCLLCSNKGENFYFNKKSDKIRYLGGKLKDTKIRSVVWDENNTEDSTKDVLLGTDDGRIIIYRIDYNLRTQEISEANFKIAVDKLAGPIINLECVELMQRTEKPLKESRIWMIIATTSKELYYFYGSTDFNFLFVKYASSDEVSKSCIPFPKKLSVPLFQAYNSKNPRRAHSLLLSNGGMLNYYKFPSKLEKIPNDLQFIYNPISLKYAKRQEDNKEEYTITEVPVDVCITEFHYYILHRDALTVISIITEKVVNFFNIDSAIGLFYNQNEDIIYVYTSKEIKEMKVRNEGKDVWKLLLEMGKIKDAYETCRRTNSPHTEYIAGLYADELFKNKKYNEAAEMYSHTNRSFEEITLKFLTTSESNDGLKEYLDRWLKNLPETAEDRRPKNGEKPKNAKKIILLTWLVELHLNQLNTMEREIMTRPQDEEKAKADNIRKLNNNFRSILEDYADDLDEDVTYSLLQSHGRFDECVHFAKKKENYEMVILHFLNEENYKKAIENLKFLKGERVLDFIYSYCHILMRHEPEALMQYLQRDLKKFDPTKLIAGLMNIPPTKRERAIDFLDYCTQTMDSSEKSINNILIFFLSESKNSDRLYDFLSRQEEILRNQEAIHFDLDFALKNFKQNGLIRAQTIIYGMMGLHSEAVSIALDNSMLKEAKSYANKPESADIKKKLWLQIAKHMLNDSGQIDEVIKLTKESPLKIEDLLPHFNEDIKIEYFKEEIGDSLKEYDKDIKALKEEMKGYSRNAEILKSELRNLKNRCFEIDSTKLCEECVQSIFTEEFYLFPCGHTYHKECLLRVVRKIFADDKSKLNHIEFLNKKLTALVQNANINNISKRGQIGGSLFSFFTKKESQDEKGMSSANFSNNAEDDKNIKETRENLDFHLAGECPSCGKYLIDTITMPFDIEDTVKKSWEINSF